MSEANSNTGGIHTAHENLIARFEQQWIAGESPNIESFLPNDTSRLAVLAELVSAEMEFRWKANQDPKLEEYLVRFPDLASHKELVIRLAKEDFRRRRLRNEPVQAIAFALRFPEVAPILETELLTPVVRTSDHSADSKTTTPTSAGVTSNLSAMTYLAKGGMGEVYVASDDALKRQVAMKVIQPRYGRNEEVLQRFVSEAEITSRLEHPGIAPVYGVGSLPDGRPCYSMRYIRGESMGDAIRTFFRQGNASSGTKATSQGVTESSGVGTPEGKRERLNLNIAARNLAFRGFLQRVISICQTLAYAHEQGVLHRDLKPDNIRLGEHGETVLLDWGLARELDTGANAFDEEEVSIEQDQQQGSRTKIGSIYGTPQFMSPEQARSDGKPLTAAADIYGLGATFYYVLTGQPPFAKDSLSKITERVERGEFERPRVVCKDVPPPLEAICLKAMQLIPKDRYTSASEMAADLERYLADEPVSVLRESTFVKMKRWIKRHPALVSTTVACSIVGLCAAIAFGYLQGAHASQLESKNLELTTAKNNAESQKIRAEEHEQDAIAAVKRFGDAVANNSELKNSPKMTSLRLELLKEPIHFFQVLRKRLQQSQETDPDSLAQLAAASFDLGRLTTDIGDVQNAIAAYQESLAIIDRLARDNPTTTKYLSALCNTHHNLGDLNRQTGKYAEALTAYEQAKAIRERLAKENPTYSKFQSDLALDHISTGVVQRQAGKPVEALASFKRAIEIQEKLVRENPKVAEYQNGLAQSQNNYGTLLNENGKLPEALTAFEKANSLFQRLARENPKTTSYQKDLAASHGNMGSVLSSLGTTVAALSHYQQAKEIHERLRKQSPTDSRIQFELSAICSNLGALHYAAGNSDEAKGEFELAKEIQERLVQENPSVVQYQNDLARSFSMIGLVLNDAGDKVKAQEVYEQAIKVQKRLAQENPGVPDFQSDLGGTLNNLAMVHLDLKDYARARDLFREAIVYQKKALSTNVAHTTYRMYLTNHYSELLKAASGLQDAAIAEEAQRGLLELAASDPSFAALDARLIAVQGGAAAKDASELASFGQRSYDLRRFAQAARFFEDALKQDASLAANREVQVPYNAACSAVLAAAGEGEVSQPLGAETSIQLRNNALRWLKLELSAWNTELDKSSKPSFFQSLIVGDTKSQARQTIAQTLTHWQNDPDLASIRDPEKLATLPEAERKEWETLWAEVRSFKEKVSAAPEADANSASPMPAQPPNPAQSPK